jgi:hypothetical protein
VYDQEKQEEQAKKRLVTKGEELASKYGWGNQIIKAADYKLLNVGKVLNTPVAEFLYYLNYMIDFNEAEDERIKKINKLK